MMTNPDQILHNEVFATGLENSLQLIASALEDCFANPESGNIADAVEKCGNGLNRMADAMDEYIRLTLNSEWEKP
jgi:hypothetical protein